MITAINIPIVITIASPTPRIAMRREDWLFDAALSGGVFVLDGLLRAEAAGTVDLLIEGIAVDSPGTGITGVKDAGVGTAGTGITGAGSAVADGVDAGAVVIEGDDLEVVGTGTAVDVDKAVDVVAVFCTDKLVMVPPIKPET